ncbi:ABC transporter permease [Spirochaeta cellobiosiphila]|uniref:fluoroquinolone export ABC transporter permease subunit n=1 Tax=Spirochaeta cellobiosiphila TaxID=504483 RepID=UPI000423AEE4|nr:ABC transporter permease [Spirochaeta cellobiosiphila]
MTSSFIPLWKNEWNLALRYGFVSIYIVLSIIYIVIVRHVPTSIRSEVLQLLIFTDPVVLGFYFVGGSVLFEKSEKVLSSLFVSPIPSYSYLLAKALNFSLLSVMVSFVITIGGIGFSFQPLILFLAVGLTSLVFTLWGLIVVSRKENVPEYLLYSLVYLIPFFIPLLGFFPFTDAWWLYLFPTQATLLLLKGSFQGISAFDLVYSIVYLLVFICISALWAKRWFDKYVIAQIGGGE